jgi:hypothetical protein
MPVALWRVKLDLHHNRHEYIQVTTKLVHPWIHHLHLTFLFYLDRIYSQSHNSNFYKATCSFARGDE